MKNPLFTFSLLLVIFNSKSKLGNYMQSPARKLARNIAAILPLLE